MHRTAETEEMLRRSLRLQEAGYYTQDGSPSISYKERLFKVFLKKSNYNSGDQRHSTDHYESLGLHDFIPDHHDLDNHSEGGHNWESIRITSDSSAAPIEIRATQTWVPDTQTTGTQAKNTLTTRTHATLTCAPNTQTTGCQATLALIMGTQATQTWGPDTKSTGTQTTCPLPTGSQATQTGACPTVKIVSGILVLLLLVFGLTHMYMQMKTVQREVELLRQRVDTSFPLVDTLPNFALRSQGAVTYSTLSSRTYWPHNIGILDRIFYWWYTIQRQTNVIRGNSRLHPGDCWPISGNQGHLFVSLSNPVSATHVTLGHIRKTQSTDGLMRSAPREFSIYGMNTMNDEGTHLGTFVYDQDGAGFQTFELTNPNKSVFRQVKLDIKSNWGNLEYTCLYNFRVHNKVVP